MSIAKGEAWGWPGRLPAGAPVAGTDAEAAALITAESSDSPRTIGLSGGDLARTLGIRPSYDAASAQHIVPVDALRIDLGDGTVHICVAHTVVGDLRRNRQSAAIMNAAFIGSRNLAPRAHPGDGKADQVLLNIALGDRFKAWKRMTSGTHVPHPGITIRQRSEGVVELNRQLPVRVDGRVIGRSLRIRYSVIPAAILVAVS